MNLGTSHRTATGEPPPPANMSTPNIPPDPARAEYVFVVGTYTDDIFGPLPRARSLAEVRLDLKQKRIARRRQKQEREKAREAELRRQMIARRKEWDEAR